MSIARHHAEWLQLVDVSGPFLSMPVLERVFPQGIDDVDAETRERLRLAHEEWLDASGDRALHQAWIRIVFRDVLGYDERDILQDSPALRLAVPEHRDTLEATFAIKSPADRPDAGKPRCLVSVVEATQDPDKPLVSAAWKTPPVDRMLLLLRGLQAAGGTCKLGLVTNGATWVLVHVAAGETTSYVRWTSELWFDEPLTLRALSTFVGARRLFGVPDDETLEALVALSSKDAQEVTDRLGAQVRRATEVLVQTIDKLDRDRRGKLLDGITPVAIYESAVSVMMRLIFLLAAEERKLLLLGTELYDQHYAVSTLHDQLQAIADRLGEEVLERRYDAWNRLLATFRAVYGGIEHADMRLPAYGGSLFDPDRFPFLEGRRPGTSWQSADQRGTVPLAIDNRTVLHLLRAITRLEMKTGGGTTEQRRLSFRALDVEQIGHVYEGLLDHTARRADDVTLSLAGKHEPEVSVAELEALAKKDHAQLIATLTELTGRGASAVEKALAYAPIAEDERKLLRVCDSQGAVYQRVRPWAGLVRNDTHGDPVVIPTGAVYVTEGSDRRSTGTHYTPRSLTEPIVQYTLEPLVYEGPAEGKPRGEWRLRSAKDILALRVCDLAMGSGAFLVQACRYLGERLVEAWEAEELRAGTKLVLAPDGRLSTGDTRELAVPVDLEERRVLARRFVADRCLYGVDVNPWAVEMGKLSLWLTTLQKGRPFSFLDHALRSGDSLLGVTHEDQLLYFHLDPARGKKLHDNDLGLQKKMKTALARSRELREKIEDFATNDINDARTKEWLLKQADDATADLRAIGDALIGAALATAKKGDDAFDRLLKDLSVYVAPILDATTTADRTARRASLQARANELINDGREGRPPRRPFHWAIAFPEVFHDDGFHCFVANPPFMGGLKLETAFGTDYRAFSVRYLANNIVGVRGTGDLCAYFLVRAFSLVRAGGDFGLLATKTVAEGDSRELGLKQLASPSAGGTIFRAVRRQPWPGSAGVDVSTVWMRRGSWSAMCSLDARDCVSISDRLEPSQHRANTAGADAFVLAQNQSLAFAGTNPMGPGFVLSLEEAASIVAASPAETPVIADYYIGKDLNELIDIRPRRRIVNFRDWSEDRAQQYPRVFQIVRDRVLPFRQDQDATDTPTRWWIHGGPRLELYKTIEPLSRVLACCQTSKYFIFRWAPAAATIFSTKAVVFAVDSDEWFALLQSNVHVDWATIHGSSLSARPVYTPVKCFGTFPRPSRERLSLLAEIGQTTYDARQAAMAKLGSEPTDFYNAVHDSSERGQVVRDFRSLVVELDAAVAGAYGWSDMVLGHGFHETKQGIRFTVSPQARAQILDRLLELNHQRYAEEVKQGLHPDAPTGAAKAPKKSAPKPKAKAATPRKKRGPEGQQTLLADDDD